MVQPLVVLIEDLHWCDASSLELVKRLDCTERDGAFARRVLHGAPEFTPPWPPRENL